MFFNNHKEFRTFTAYSMPPQLHNLIVIWATLTMIVMSWFSMGLEALARHDFGERYFTPFRVWLAYMTMTTFTFLYTILSVVGGGNPLMLLGYTSNLRTLFANGVGGLLYHLFVYSFIATSIAHLLRIWNRNRKGIVWHSQSYGISWLELLPWHLLTRVPYVGRFLIVTDSVLARFIEPALFFTCGNLLWHVDHLLGWWLIIASVALGIKSHIAYQMARSAALDMMDGQIESHYLAASLSGSHKQGTAGWNVIAVPMPEMIESQPLDIEATVRATLGSE